MGTFEHLPFLVVYGETIWKVFVGVCVLIGLVLSLPRRRSKARKASRRTLETLGPPVESVDAASNDEIVTLRGHLRAERTIPQLQDEAPVVVSTAFALSTPKRGIQAEDPLSHPTAQIYDWSSVTSRSSSTTPSKPSSVHESCGRSAPSVWTKIFKNTSSVVTPTGSKWLWSSSLTNSSRFDR